MCVFCSALWIIRLVAPRRREEDDKNIWVGSECLKSKLVSYSRKLLAIMRTDEKC